MAPFTERTPRVVSARRLTKRAAREEAGRFLAEGANAVEAALLRHQHSRGFVYQLFVTASAAQHCSDLVARARALAVSVSLITEKAAAGLSETVTPQGIIAVCQLVSRPVDEVLRPGFRLVAVLADISDPGNAGTVIRTADAAGVDAVVLAGNSVDPHNGKCVRASAGSLFQIPIGRTHDVDAAITACRSVGLRVLAATGSAQRSLADLRLGEPTAWVFGNEAHGLPEAALRSVDEAVRIPIYGKAESLNLATAAAVILYHDAMAQGTDRPGSAIT